MSDRRLQQGSAWPATWMRAIGVIGWGGGFRLLALVAGLGLLGLLPTPASALLLAYIPNDTIPGTVSVIDTATNTIKGTILVGNEPYGIAAHPDLTRVYVTNSGSHYVSVIDTAINREIAAIPVGRIPHGIAVHPAGTRVYVANGNNGAGNTVSVINTATNTVMATVTVGDFPNGVAVHPSGRWVYVTNINSHSVSVIDTTTDTIHTTIPGLRKPHDVTFNHAGTLAYVTNTQSLDACPAGSVSVIDTTTHAVRPPPICMGSFPHSPVVHPDGTRVYVTNRGGDEVVVISTATNTVIATIPVKGIAPHGIDVHPDGTFAYVANAGSKDISVINLATDTVVATIPVGNNPIAQGRFILPGSIVPSISGLVPDTGGDIGNVSVFIYGQGFAQDATVKLMRPGQPDILGTSVQVQGFGDTITTTFALAGKARGPWTVVVANPDGTSITLPDGFTIEEGRAAQVWVDIVGHSAIRAGREQIFHILYGNRGNINIYDIVLFLRLPKGEPFSVQGLLPPATQPPPEFNQVGLEMNSEILIPIWIYTVPAGFTGNIRLNITPQIHGPGEILTIKAEILTPPASEFSRTGDFVFTPFFLDLVARELAKAMARVLLEDSATQLHVGVLNSSAASSNACDPEFPEICEELLRRELYPEMLAEARAATNPRDYGLGVSLHIITAGACAGAAVGVITLPVCFLGLGAEAIIAVQDLLSASQAIQRLLNQRNALVVGSSDPNEKAGSQGSGSLQYLSDEEPLRYAILFENLETATAPAQEVIITDQLDQARMDLSTLSLGLITFGDKQVIPPPGLSNFTTDVDLRPGGGKPHRQNYCQPEPSYWPSHLATYLC